MIKYRIVQDSPVAVLEPALPKLDVITGEVTEPFIVNEETIVTPVEGPSWKTLMGRLDRSIICGDCLDVLPTLPENSIDSIVTDPPAGIAFMGKDWDTFDRKGFIDFMEKVARECLRVVKPGGHALVWALPRTTHWTAMVWENAGWEPRDRIAHCFGSGFPKSLNISKAIDKEAGAEPATAGAIVWDGWGTGLKPAIEDWWLFRKPIEKGLTIAQNVLKWGTGGINVDGCRVGTEGATKKGDKNKSKSIIYGGGISNGGGCLSIPGGRFPANLIHDGSEEVVSCFPMTGGGKFKQGSYRHKAPENLYALGTTKKEGALQNAPDNYGDQGSASRYFKCCSFDKTVDEACFSMYNYSIPEGGILCGNISENQKADGILIGVLKEVEKFTTAVELLICGENKTETYLRGIASTILISIKLMTELKTLNALVLKSITIFMHENEKIIKLLMELNTDDVRNAKNIKYLITFKNEVLELIKDIVKIVSAKLYETGEIKTETIGTPITENTVRLIYQSKASKQDRDEGLENMESQSSDAGALRDNGRESLPRHNPHPTVKSTKLMAYLCRLITPPNGLVLDPFAGSGSTGKACKQEGFRFLGIEKDEEYARIARARIA